MGLSQCSGVLTRTAPQIMKPCSLLGPPNEDCHNCSEGPGQPQFPLSLGSKPEGKSPNVRHQVWRGGAGTYLDLPCVVGDDQTQKDDGRQTDKAFQGQRKHGILQEKWERIRTARKGAGRSALQSGSGLRSMATRPCPGLGWAWGHVG